MSPKAQRALVQRIIKRYGATIDLRKNPEVIIDIIRKFAEDPDGGLPPGGAPSPPPGPSSMQGRVTTTDLMRAVLKLSKEVSTIKKALGGKRATGR